MTEQASNTTKYTFSGRVLPERANFSISKRITLGGYAKEYPLKWTMNLSINASQISATVDAEGKEIHLPSLKNYIEESVRNVVDSYGYIAGIGYDVEITSAIDQTGNQTVFGVDSPEIGRTKHERPLQFEEILQLCKSEHLRRALGDLREAIRAPLDTGFFCYRAIEDLARHFLPPGKTEFTNGVWEKFRDSLQIDRGRIDFVKNYADLQRHGDTPFMSGETRGKIMLHTWKIVDRFCIYAKQGFQPLSKQEFPQLKNVQDT